MLPDRIVFRYSIFKKLLGFLVAALLLMCAVMLWNNANGTGSYIIATIVTLAAAFSFFMNTREILGLRKTRLILDAKGVTNAEGQFYAWGTIHNPRVEYTGSRFHSLLFTVQARQPYNVNIDVSELGKSPDEIAELVKQYRELSIANK